MGLAHAWPCAIGLPPDNSLSCCTNWMSSMTGDPNAEWRGGDAQSVTKARRPRPCSGLAPWPIWSARIAASSSTIVAGSRRDTATGWLGALAQLDLDRFTCSFVAFSLNWSGQKARVPLSSIALPRQSSPSPRSRRRRRPTDESGKCRRRPCCGRSRPARPRFGPWRSPTGPRTSSPRWHGRRRVGCAH